MSSPTQASKALLSEPQVDDTKTQMRYSDRAIDMDGTAYEPYAHRGSDHDPRVQPRTVSSGKNRPPAGSRGLRRACVVFSTISTAISLGILGVSIEVVITLAQTKTARLLWDYNMMMKAWPLTGAPAVPTYVTMSAASATAMLNIILLLSVLFGRDRIYSPGVASAFGMATHVLLAAWFAAALVANGYYQPNLRSWACANGSIEQTYKSNVVGLSKVCVNMFAVFISSIVAGSFELFNAMTIMFIIVSERRRARAKANFPKARNYKKLDPSAEEQDEIPMLAVSRKSVQ